MKFNNKNVVLHMDFIFLSNILFLINKILSKKNYFRNIIILKYI